MVEKQDVTWRRIYCHDGLMVMNQHKYLDINMSQCYKQTDCHDKHVCACGLVHVHSHACTHARMRTHAHTLVKTSTTKIKRLLKIF